jgi:MFS family permease
MGAGIGVMYAYYSTVYATIQDIVEPALRGTAMAMYFCAMYLAGASLGPIGTGFISDYFTARAAAAAGVVDHTTAALEPFRAAGLHSAMYVIPALVVLLALVLFAASRTVRRDIDALRAWTASNS